MNHGHSLNVDGGAVWVSSRDTGRLSGTSLKFAFFGKWPCYKATPLTLAGPDAENLPRSYVSVVRCPGLREPKNGLFSTPVLRVDNPAIERFKIEAPVTSHFKRRQLPLPEQAINCRRMNSQILRHFFHCHYFGSHSAALPLNYQCFQCSKPNPANAICFL